MNARAGMLLGAAITAAAATWWLGAVMLAMRGAGDVAPLAEELLGALWLLRALTIAVLGVRSVPGASAGNWRGPLIPLLAIILVPWPLVLIAFEAGTAPLGGVLGAEISLIAAAVGLGALGRALNALPLRGTIQRPLATAVGVLLAAGLWWQRAWWFGWFSA